MLCTSQHTIHTHREKAIKLLPSVTPVRLLICLVTIVHTSMPQQGGRTLTIHSFQLKSRTRSQDLYLDALRLSASRNSSNSSLITCIT